MPPGSDIHYVWGYTANLEKVQQNQVAGAKFQKQDVFGGIVGSHLVEQYPHDQVVLGVTYTANWIITIKSSWTKLPQLFYQPNFLTSLLYS